MLSKAVGAKTDCALYPGEDQKLKNRILGEGFAAKLYGHIPPTSATRAAAVPQNGGYSCHCMHPLH